MPKLESIERRGERSPMQYRRFGRTQKALSVITLGGMRFPHGWDAPRDELPAATIEACRDSVSRAFALGINHIETAHGYMKSERCYGRVLNEELRVPRSSYFFMTKGAPKTGDETKRMIEEQLTTLGMSYFDFYAWHGINNREKFQLALAKGGPVEVLKRYQEQGVIGNVGFSTHAPYRIICEAIATDVFDFVNLHYYYFRQRNFGAIELAASHDMGVFIISPNDKGGQLFDPPPLLQELTAPLTPIQFNARFCLRTPYVHTLSFGMNQSQHFAGVPGIFPVATPPSLQDQAIVQRLDARLLTDPHAAYEGWELENDPSGINIPEVLRFRRMLKCYDMKSFGLYRYNMFSPGDDWVPGALATPENVARVDEERAPAGFPLRQLLSETHGELYRPKPNKRGG
ncbi:MAG TPA: aldo/keto reductase [Polyangiaceae bacterium]|nr:aldo/keto reductase [Polyangiaceae bacterium]